VKIFFKLHVLYSYKSVFTLKLLVQTCACDFRFIWFGWKGFLNLSAHQHLLSSGLSNKMGSSVVINTGLVYL